MCGPYIRAVSAAVRRQKDRQQCVAAMRFGVRERRQRVTMSTSDEHLIHPENFEMKVKTSSKVFQFFLKIARE